MSTTKFLTFHRQVVTSLSRSLSTSLASQSRRRVTTATSRGTGSQSLHLPPLMDLPNIVNSSLMNTSPDSFISRALLTSHFDPDFSRKEFDQEARKAAVIVANCLAEGDFDSLSSLVTSKATH